VRRGAEGATGSGFSGDWLTFVRGVGFGGATLRLERCGCFGKNHCVRISRIVAFTAFALITPGFAVQAQTQKPAAQKQRKSQVQNPLAPGAVQAMPNSSQPLGSPAPEPAPYPVQSYVQPQYPQRQYPQPQPAGPPQQYPQQYQQPPQQYQQPARPPVQYPQQYEQSAGYPPPQASTYPPPGQPYPQQPAIPNPSLAPAYPGQQAYPPTQLQNAAARQNYPQQMQPYSPQPRPAPMPGPAFDSIGLVARDQAEDLPRVAVTLSPFHLALPVVHLTGEYRLGEQLGIAAIFGVGRIKGSSSGLYEIQPTYTAFEVGGKFHYYAVGNFRHGMQVGGEVLVIHVTGADKGVSQSATGLLVGPFLGYKYTAGFGLTFEAQLGMAREGIGASKSTGDELTKSAWAALLNLNVGWSF
jgi:hypothetical protein